MTLLIGFSIFSLLYAWQVDAASSNCTTGSWIVGGSISLDSTTCDLATVTAALAGGSACLSTIYPTNTAAEVARLCSGVEVPFGSISNTPINYQSDKNYFDGGTLMNIGNQTKLSENIGTVGGQVGRFLTTRSATSRVAWPTYPAVSGSGFDATGFMPNFHLGNSCGLRAAMCCFTNNLLPSAPVPKNANACVHNVSSSSSSAHVKRGSTRYDISGDDAYCVGFSWTSNPSSNSFKYKGNLLFASSLAQTFQLGYSGNLPSAPMCGCVEQMPIVTASDCISIDNVVETGINLIWTGKGFTAKLVTSVTYGNCNGNRLKQNYATMSSPAEQAALATRIVDQCDTSTAKFMNDRFMVSGTKNSPVDLTRWTQVVGKGYLYYPTIGEDNFRQLMTLRPDNRYPLVYRYCQFCSDFNYRNIYYRRYPNRPYPTNLEFLNLFMSNWTSVNNTLGVDFDLYGSYSDAINGVNAWKVCNYDDPSGAVGFPRDCGPTALGSGYWNTYAIGASISSTDPAHAFYVEK